MKIVKYFIEFTFVLSLFTIFKIIGLKNASFLGGLIGKIIGPKLRSKELIKKNISIVFPKISLEEQEKIINSMWENYGRTFAEYMYLKTFRKSILNEVHIKINGIKKLEKIKAEKTPVVFFSGHFANFELMAMTLDKLDLKIAAIYRPLNNFFLNPIIEYLRMKYICPIQIPKGKKGLRELLEKVLNGYNIALMVDQKLTEGEKISFFEKEASTTTIPAQLALKYKYKIVPIFLERLENTNFEMSIDDPLEVNDNENSQAGTKNIMLQVNQKIEKMIKKNPHQWIWSHNRWKE